MDLLAPGAVLVERVVRADDDAEALLGLAERRAVARAVPARVREYAAGRRCAHLALARLGLDPALARADLLADADRVPRWPVSVVGTITHCAGYAAAAVAWAADLDGLGLDAEPHAALPPEVLDVVVSARDRLDAADGVHVDRVAFCAKEAAYKACFPRVRRRLEFVDIVVDLDRTGAFAAAVPGSGTLHGRWDVVDALVRAAVTVPAGSLGTA